MGAELIDSIDHLRDRISRARRAGATIGLVPTMGALHAGHARLIERAREECHRVVVSIFVNPLQFDREEDLARYPRTLERDIALCDGLDVNVVFAPTVSEMYPAPVACTVDVGQLANHLCGPHRPGHFSGVATVVLKLLGIVQPDRAYFGEKDAQQLAIIRHLVGDMNVPVRIVGVATVREADGLALSSRNRHLSASERRSAPALFRALQRANERIAAGDADPDDVRRLASAEIPADDAALRLEYLEIVDPDSMQPVRTIVRPVRVAGALWVGGTRLIDNVLSTPPA